MKWGVLVAMLVLGGCASVTDIEKTLPTLSVISGKKPDAYAQCLVEQLSKTRKAPQIEPHKDGLRIIVPQKLTSNPTAVIDIEERSGGSSIKVFESMSNVPVRPGDIRKAATHCISGE
ncbi:hypothetical protein [Pseudomonas psychrophila]|uniref:hypothetical protein n=1 Tax=Pseudomonas psychrophila TaxID=122355 RepID=UPI0003055589|nr:hypothetical protein [Pseudomonas psychrophila]